MRRLSASRSVIGLLCLVVIHLVVPGFAAGSDTLGNAHKILGYGTLLAGAAAAFSGSDSDGHHVAAYVACILGGATCATGLLSFSGWIDLSDGFSKYDWHALVTGVATAGFITAVALAEAEEDHSGIGSGSFVAMTIPIVAIRFW